MNDRKFDVSEHVSEQEFKDMCVTKTKAILNIVAGTGGAIEEVARKGSPDDISDKEMAEAMAEMHAGQAALFAAVDHNAQTLTKQGILGEQQGAAFRAILPIISLMVGAGIARNVQGAEVPKNLPDNVIPFPEGGKKALH